MLTNTPEFMADVLNTDEFGNALHETAEHTIHEEKEAGFVVYRGSNRRAFIVSGVVHGTQEINLQDGELAHTVDLKDLILDKDEMMRTDLMLVAHSHPEDFPGQAPAEALTDIETFQEYQARRGRFATLHKRQLFPSDGDMALYSRINQSNEGHTAVILTCDREIAVAGLLMYRHRHADPPRISPPFDLSTMSFNKESMLSEMVKNGYACVETEYDFARHAYGRDPSELTSELYSASNL